LAKKIPDKNSELGPYPPDQTLGAIAGCPFTGFKGCAAEKCAFFVAVPPELTERECIIRATYTTTLIQNVLLASAAINTIPAEELVPNRTLIQRAVESLVGSLESLDGLATHPSTGPALAKEIQSMKKNVYQAMKNFSIS